MSATREIPAQTKESQLRASHPAHSAWVSAHAGSGKTHVLSQRVLRLLLERVPPARILCLTYTKAAAANMAARVFDSLARWALMDDAALVAAVRDTTGKDLSPQRMDFARRLFARAVETPGGLKIQTIHAFCERTLHLFPFEANVPANFRVLDDIERADLLLRARRDVLARAIAQDHPLRGAVDDVALAASDHSFEALVSELLGFRDALRHGEEDSIFANALRRKLGLFEGETPATIEARMIEGGLCASLWPRLAERLRQGSAKDQGLAQTLESAARLAPHRDCLEAYRLVFFTKEGAPRGGDRGLLTQGLGKKDPELQALLEAERDRLTPLIGKLCAAAAFERSHALARLGGAIVADYERKKNARGLFDFDDLIERMRMLLRRSNPSWVLYKLDQQIDHVLLDEAQDTSAPQWEILQAIATEFAQAASPRARTFFAVGDEKQSIFSFQGAAPKKFDEMRRDFEKRLREAQLTFENVRLHLSFRSSPVILDCVDKIFAHGENRSGLSFSPEEPAPVHEAWKKDAPGLVEIWDAVGAQSEEPGREWRLPMDYVSGVDPAARLARKVARKIKALLAQDSGEWVLGEDGPRAITPGDVLILVRRRNAFFEAIIRALKEQHIAVAGADRLDLANHLAVMDLCALGRAALLDADDLTLAILLKSPLVGLGDDDLIALAPNRPGALIDALNASAAPSHIEAAERLARWREDAHLLAPFDFFAKALGPGGGRKRLVARLGAKANDAIDEFLRLALAYERETAQGLTGFIASVEKLDVSIKRDMEAAGDAVRVMTAHAAKGLEAKIVFLPDTCGAPNGAHDPKLFPLGAEEDEDDVSLAWSPRKGDDPAAVARARERQRQEQREEYRRLFYVALTRAEERLYIAGYHGAKGPAEGCWLHMARAALEPHYESLPDPDPDYPDATILRSPDAPKPAPVASAAPARTPVGIPAFARTPAAAEASPPRLRPSTSLDAAEDVFVAAGAAPTRQDGELLLIGRLAHALLQYLPQTPREDRARTADVYLRRRAKALGEGRLARLRDSVLRVIDSPALAPLFGPRSMAEVDIAAKIETRRGPREVVGRIDRLAVEDDAVFLADFKTGRPRDAVDSAQLRQLALYRAAVAPLYPGKRLRCALVFTQDASFVEPGDAALDAALEAVE